MKYRESGSGCDWKTRAVVDLRFYKDFLIDMFEMSHGILFWRCCSMNIVLCWLSFWVMSFSNLLKEREFGFLSSKEILSVFIVVV